MIDIPWLHSDAPFPSTRQAFSTPNGLLAAGADLSPDRLISAYRKGIFPWYSEGEPILWWTPSPRTVFTVGDVYCSKSLAKFLRQKQHWRVTIDTCFTDVMTACASPRADDQGTWISPQMIAAFSALHHLGYAHSVEVFEGDELVGGLYGVALGRVFFGESMWSGKPNGSKVALLTLDRWLKQHGFVMIDAQVHNDHLARMGASQISREDFERTLHLNTTTALIDSMQIHWQTVAGKNIRCEGHL